MPAVLLGGGDVVTRAQVFMKWLECARRGRHIFGLGTKCICCGAEADAPTLLELLRKISGGRP